MLYRRLWEQMRAFKVCFKRRCVAIDCNAVRVLMFGLGCVRLSCLLYNDIKMGIVLKLKVTVLVLMLLLLCVCVCTSCQLLKTTVFINYNEAYLSHLLVLNTN